MAWTSALQDDKRVQRCGVGFEMGLIAGVEAPGCDRMAGTRFAVQQTSSPVEKEPKDLRSGFTPRGIKGTDIQRCGGGEAMLQAVEAKKPFMLSRASFVERARSRRAWPFQRLSFCTNSNARGHAARSDGGATPFRTSLTTGSADIFIAPKPASG